MIQVTDGTTDQLYGDVDRIVHVNAYYRIRFGRVEFVKEHFRKAWGVLK